MIFVTVSDFVAQDGATGSFSRFFNDGLEIARQKVNHLEFQVVDKSVREATPEDIEILNSLLEKEEDFKWRDFMSSNFRDQW